MSTENGTENKPRRIEIDLMTKYIEFEILIIIDGT